jgi:hypothetical protein
MWAAIEKLLTVAAGIFNAAAAKEKARADDLERQLNDCRATVARKTESYSELEAALEMERRWRRTGASAGDRMDELLGGKPGAK